MGPSLIREKVGWESRLYWEMRHNSMCCSNRDIFLLQARSFSIFFCLFYSFVFPKIVNMAIKTLHLG
uniref:Uncharacterized protein n=1 Tax=Rhizophora mucronata TaxID=61149 RepID=A0A2P2PM70_RHIMU